MTEVWNNVTIYGPIADVARFRRNCVRPEEDVFRDHQSGWDGCDCTISLSPKGGSEDELSPAGENGVYVRNFQQFTLRSKIEYSFSFDTEYEFPVWFFERLAIIFPCLAFDCDCIESMDEFMGYGWFNAPPGGEEFRQNYEVPADYWTTGSGHKRGFKAQTAHKKRIGDLRDELRKAANDYGLDAQDSAGSVKRFGST